MTKQGARLRSAAIFLTATFLLMPQLTVAGTQIYTSSDTFTVPPDVTQLNVFVVGGGGGGGGGNSGWGSGAGGGCGGGIAGSSFSVSPGQTFSVVVGAGGAGGGAASNGGTGGASSFGSISAPGGSWGRGGYYNLFNGSPGGSGGGSGGGGGGNGWPGYSAIPGNGGTAGTATNSQGAGGYCTPGTITSYTSYDCSYTDADGNYISQTCSAPVYGWPINPGSYITQVSWSAGQGGQVPWTYQYYGGGGGGGVVINNSSVNGSNAGGGSYPGPGGAGYGGGGGGTGLDYYATGGSGASGVVYVEWATPASCTFNGQTIASASSVTAFQSASVPYGSSCVSQTRTCHYGTLSGTYAYSSCSVNPPPPTVSAISPVNGVNTASVSISSVTGANFVSGATVTLTKSGQSNISCTGFTFTNSTTLSSGTCPISGGAVGAWNVVVTNPDAQTGTLANGFAVNTPAPSATLTASTLNYIQGGAPVTFTWGSSFSTSCSGTNFSTGGATSGSVSVTPAMTTTYSVTCTGSGGSKTSSVTVNYTPNTACVQTANSTAIIGYAWSDNLGWIDLNCANSGMCGTNSFGMGVDSNGDISGCGWSDSIGWVSATQAALTNCPQGECKAKLASNNMQGWMRALAADGNVWDGWISLNGSSPQYGVTQNPNGTLTGYAWGSDIVGWVDFSYARVGYPVCTPAYTCNGQTIQYTNNTCQTSDVTTCVSPAFCSLGSSTCLYPQPQYNTFTSGANSLTGHLQVVPSLLPVNTRTKLFWNVSSVSSCSVTGTNGDNWTGLLSGINGIASAPIIQQTTFTLSCIKLDNSSFSEKQTVNIVPVFQER